MRILAQDPSGNPISIDQFFAKYPEFSQNRSLAEETRHILRVIVRCAEPDLFAKKRKNGYAVILDGATRTYELTFERNSNAVVLTALQ